MPTPLQEKRPAVDGATFREAMSRLPAPLTVVTTRDEDGRPWGFTASAVTSVSLDPPLVLVGIAHASSCHRPLTQVPEFVINVLGDEHRDLADRFAARGVDRFAGAPLEEWPDSPGLLPHVPDALALRCALADRITLGDHDLLVGRVLEVRLAGSGRPLFWYQRAFRTTG
ncbi:MULTISPECIES: flavin reductase family protein [unclassified Streptomyces]|uniref:flavin reductase family protein n=1 Tax=unclassified Streptomyces TaxID=2593676 RepID=UPI0033C1873B